MYGLCSLYISDSLRNEGKTWLLQTYSSLVAQTVKRLPTMRETWVQSLGREDLLEKEMVTHSSILAWKIPWSEKPVGYRPWDRKESDTTEQLHSLHYRLVLPIILEKNKQSNKQCRSSIRYSLLARIPQQRYGFYLTSRTVLLLALNVGSVLGVSMHCDMN